MSTSSNQRKPLIIQAYKDPKFKQKIGSDVKLQINPESIKHDHSISYSDAEMNWGSGQAPLGSPGKTLDYGAYGPQAISFTFYLDATGIIPGCDDIMDKIQEFKTHTYEYDGDIHSPYYLKLIWSDIFKGREKNRLFRCKLTNLSITYKLFKPDGTPLRAELSATFNQCLTQDEIKKITKRSSPDLTHVRIIKAGDRLPLLCHEIYGDSSYYWQVAEINGLRNLSELIPGQKITFPPLQK